MFFFLHIHICIYYVCTYIGVTSTFNKYFLDLGHDHGFMMIAIASFFSFSFLHKTFFIKTIILFTNEEYYV